jgi:5'-3' exonuclease
MNQQRSRRFKTAVERLAVSSRQLRQWQWLRQLHMAQLWQGSCSSRTHKRQFHKPVLV